jgi:hypothetical protein
MFFSQIFINTNGIACGGDVDMSVPHIHDEHAILIHVKNAKHSELKQIDIYQIFDGKLEHEHNHHETADHKEEGKTE